MDYQRILYYLHSEICMNNHDSQSSIFDRAGYILGAHMERQYSRLNDHNIFNGNNFFWSN